MEFSGSVIDLLYYNGNFLMKSSHKLKINNQLDNFIHINYKALSTIYKEVI